MKDFTKFSGWNRSRWMKVLMGIVGMFFTMNLHSQTTYYWVGGSTSADVSASVWSTTLGGAAVVPTVSNANIFVVDGSDISSVAGSQTGTVNIDWTVSTATRALGQFKLQNNATVILTASSAGGRSYTIGGSIAGDDFVIGNGSTLNLSTNQSLAMVASSSANISGRLNIEASRIFDTDAASVITTVSATGYIFNQGTLTCTTASKLVFNGTSSIVGSNYEHNQNGGSIPTATWNSYSTCKFTGVTNLVPTIPAVTLNNLIWSNAGQNASLNLGLTSVNGDYKVLNTNSQTLRMTSGCSGGTITVNGSFEVSGTSSLIWNSSSSCGAGPYASTFNVKGDFTIGQGATFEMPNMGTNTTLNINFNGTSQQTFTNSGTLTNTYVNYTIASGATLLLASDLPVASSRTATVSGTLIFGTGASPKNVTGAGTFTATNATATTLKITDPYGITKGTGATSTAGNIRVTTTRVAYGAAINYHYTGTSAQATGDALPASATNITGSLVINNSAGVTLSQYQIIQGTLTLTSGVLTTSASNYIKMDYRGTLSGGGTTNYVDGPFRWQLTNTNNHLFPVGSGGNYRPIEFNSVSCTSGGEYEVTTSSTGATTADGSTITALGTRNWYAKWINPSAAVTSAVIKITESGLDASSRIGSSTAQSGTYASSGAVTVSGSTLATTSAFTLNQTSYYFAIGTICSGPSTQASSVSSSSTTVTGSTISWTNGNGTAGRIVVAYPGASAGTTPTIGTSYTANAAYGSGTALGTGFVVYNGTGSSVTVSGLSAVTQYTFVVYEYDATYTCYNKTTTAAVSVTTLNKNYRSATSGNWATNATWESSNDGGSTWSAASATPTSTDGTITIRSGHTVTVAASVTTDETTVDVGGILSVSSSQTLTIANGSDAVDLTVNGTLTNAGTVTTTGAVTIAGTYNHTRDGGVIPSATWSSGSTCNVTGMTGTAPTGMMQAFHHVIWNCTGQTVDFKLNNSSSLTFGGDFTLINTGSTPKNFSLNDNGPAPNYLIVGGNMNIQGGIFIITANSTGYANVTVGGNMSLTNTGTFYGMTNNNPCTLTVNGDVSTTANSTFKGSSIWSNSTATFNFAGNVDFSLGTVQAFGSSGTQDQKVTINLTGTNKTLKLPANGGIGVQTANYPINWSININSGASITLGSDIYIGGFVSGSSRDRGLTVSGTLIMGTYVVYGAATYSFFTTNSGSTLKTANTLGIVTAGTASGAVQTGVRTFNAAATYEYNGTAAQVTGTGLPTPLTTPGGLVINNTEAISSSSTGVSLTQATTVSTGTVTLTNGLLTTTSNLLSITNTATGAITRANSAYVNGPLSWSIASGSSSYLFPVGKGGNYYPFTFSDPAGTLPVLKVEAYASNCGGSGLTLSTTEYWKVDYSGTSVTGGIVKLERPTAISPLNIVATSATSNGVYSSLYASSSTSTSVTATNSVGTVTTFAKYYTFAACTDNIYYVSTSGSDANAGTTSGTAFATLQKAIDMAGCGTTTINVAAGTTYSESNITIANKSNITITGAGITSTVFDGTTANRFMTISGTSSNIAISGLKITDYEHATQGGGFAITTSTGTVTLTSVHVDNCVLTAQASSNANGGGGMYVSSTSTVKIYKSKFTNNSNNTNSYANHTAQDGGSILCNGNLTLENCLFYDNIFSTYGGPYDGDVAIKNSAARLTVDNCTFVSNSNGQVPIFVNDGGGSCPASLVVRNSIFNSISGNKAIFMDGCTLNASISNSVYTTSSTITSVTATACTTAADADFFIDKANKDFRSTGSSTFVNAGAQFSGYPTVDFDGTTRVGNPDIGCYEFSCPASNGTYTVGTSGTFKNLTTALAFLKSCQTGNVILELDETYRTTEEALETYPLNFAGLLTSNSISLTIRPKSNVTALITIGGSSTTTMLDFNGTDYVTIDGRIGSTGATSLITIDNTSTTSGATAINFYSTATNNTLQYCTLKSTATGATSGVVTFGTGSNATNTITYCNIDGGAGATAAPANAARVGIYSTGTANDNMTITNNNVYNCFNTTVVSPHAGIYVGNGSSAWTITGNSIYQTSNRTVTGNTEYYGIVISNTSSVGNTVSNNYIGGTSSSCGSTKFTFAGTYSNIFRGIYINCGTSSSTTVNGNTVANLSFTSSLAGSYFYGIQVAGGNVNIGTTSGTGNTIGSRTVNASTAANASIQLIPTASTANNALGIYSIITANHTINYNRVAGINVNNSNTAYPATFYGIYPAGTSSDAPTVTYNSVGSSNNTSSIVVGTNATAGVNTFYGIVNQGYTGVVSMQYDTIQGVKVYGTDASLVYPIYNTTGATNSSISFNTIMNVSNESSGSNATAALIGIYNAAAAQISISSNTISAITCKNGYFRGIQDNVVASGTHTISSNTIGSSSVNNDISISSTSTTVSMGINAASTGIYTISSNTIQNISQSGTAQKDLYGIQVGSTGTYTVSGNTIDKLYNNSTGSYRSSLVGVNMAGIPNTASVIEKNKITNFKNLNSNGGYIYGILGTTATSLKAYNNFFECDNEGSSNNNTLSIYGIYGDLITSLVAYHNTIYISGATSVNSVDGHSFCIRQGATPNVKNNILINTRTDGGASASQGITFGTFSDATYDYNYYYVKDATLTSGGGTSSIYHRDGSNTLPTINSDGSLPSASVTIVGSGTNLTATVVTDIFGTNRSTSPTKGCYEYVLITIASNAITAANNCASTLKVPIQSFTITASGGTGNLTNVGFTTTGTYVQADIAKYQLWYGTSSSLGSAAQLGSDLASSGVAGARTFASFTTPTLTNATAYYFWITVDLTSSVVNDNTIAVNAITTSDLTSTSAKTGTTSAGGTQTLKALPIPTFTAQAGASACASSDVTYTTEASKTNYTWTVPGTLNTDYSITSGTLGTGSNTVTLKWLTSGSKTVTINYTDGNSCTAVSATSSTATTVNTLPSAPTAVTPSSGVSICNGSSTNLNATSAGNTINWYTVSSAGSSLGTSSSAANFSVSPTSNTTYYAESYSTAGCVSSTRTATALVTVNSPTAGVIATSQTICSGTAPSAFTSTTDGTGTGTVAYEWQTNASGSYADIGSQTTATYQAPSLTATTSYQRRTVAVSDGTTCYSSYTTPVAITVNAAPTAGVIATAQTICSGTVPSAFTSTTNGTGTGTVTYEWQTNASGSYADIGSQTSATYQAPSLTATTSYQRRTVAVSGGTTCYSLYTTPVAITVNAAPTAGVIAAAQTICSGTAPSAFTSTTDGTGTGTVTYEWQTNASGSYADIATQTTATYQAPSLTATTSYQRRTVAVSGGATCYSSYTTPVAINVNALPSAPTAVTPSSGVSICNGSSTNLNATSAGNTIYWYTVSSAGSSLGTSSSAANFSVSPTSNTTYYAESYSSAGCASATRTATALVTIDEVTVLGTAGTSQSITSGSTAALTLSGNTGTIQWQESADGATGWTNVVSGSGATSTAYTTGSLTSTNYYRVVVTSGVCSAVNSSPITITVISGVTTFYFKGSGDLNNKTSWTSNSDGSTVSATIPTAMNNDGYTFYILSLGSNAIPTLNGSWTLGTGSKIIVGNGTDAVNFTVPYSISGGSIDVSNNATLTISTTSVPTLGSIDAGSTVLYTASSGTQTIPAKTYGNLTLINSSDKTAGGAIIVNGILSLSGGAKLTLNGNNLTIGSSGEISGYNASNFIVTNSTGKVFQNGLGSSTTLVGKKTFPIGISSSSYTPIILENSGTTDDFSVRVGDHRYADGISTGASRMHAVDRTWFVEEGTPSGSNVKMIIQWNAADELSYNGNAFNRLNCFISHYTGGAWDSGTQTGGPASGTGPYTIDRSNITSFSPFGVEDPQALPITLIDFTAKAEGKKVRLDWETGTEENNDYFTIEHSLDGKNFEQVFTKKGAGNSKVNLYYFGYDAKPYTGVSYYRLKQTDFDGKFAYSDIVSVKMLGEQMRSEMDVQVYPNPVSNQLIHVDLNAQNNGTYTMHMINEIGQQVFADTYEVVAGENNFEIQLPKVVTGIYMLEIRNQNEMLIDRVKVTITSNE